MADLLAAARTTAALTKFIEEDLVGLMAQLDISAAGIALSGIPSARDKRSAWWSAVNHLEGAESKLRSRMKTASAFDSAQTYLYISAIKALIFRYLGEERLIAKCLEDSKDIVQAQQRFESTFMSQIKGVASLFKPSTWVEAIRRSGLRRAARDFRPEPFWEAMGFPGSHDLRLLIVAVGARGHSTISYWPGD
jgi:hypothetical protein